MSLVETFRSSPPRRQLTFVALGAALTCALLVAGYFAFVHKPYQVLFTDLRAMDAATIVGDLDKKKISYRLADGGGTILVPKDKVDSTRLSVMGEDLPLKGMVGFELFNKSDMGLTEFAQKINYQRALQGELARTIMTMDAVDTARVHLSLSTPTIFREDRIPPKASITILTRPGKSLSAGSVRGIQRLVAAAVPELDLASVVVLDHRGEVLSGDLATEIEASPAIASKQAVEDYYAGRVRMALQRAYPVNAAQVSVSAPQLGVDQPIDGHLSTIENWSPETRDFGLNVAISTATILSPQDQQEFRYLVSEAIGSRPLLGDTVAITASPTPLAAPPATASAPRANVLETAKPKARPTSALGLTLILGGSILLLLLGASFLNQRRTVVRTLTAQQRGEYTQRLKTLLEREDGGVDKAA